MWQYTVIAVLFAGYTGGVWHYSYEAGKNSEIAKHSELNEVIDKVEAKAASGAASAISGIEIKNTTIYGKLQKEVYTNTVYAECKHTPDGLRQLNEALENRTPASGSTGGGNVPSQTGSTPK